MTHREIKELIPLLAIGRLEGEEKRKVMDHLRTCEECRRIYENERNLLALMEGTASEVIPPPLPTVRRRGFSGRVLTLALSGIAVATLLVVLFLVKGYFGETEEGTKAPVPVEIVGLDDLWDGYVLVQGDGEISVKVTVDGKVVATEKGKDYVYLEPDVDRGEHYVKVTVVYHGDTVEVDRVVLYDPETYAMATGEE